MEAYNIRRVGSSEGLNGRPISIKPMGETRKRERVRKNGEEEDKSDLIKQNTVIGGTSRSPRGLESSERLFASTSKDFFPSSNKGFDHPPIVSTSGLNFANRDLAEVEEEPQQAKGGNGFFPPISKKQSSSKLDDPKLHALGDLVARKSFGHEQKLTITQTRGDRFACRLAGNASSFHQYNGSLSPRQDFAAQTMVGFDRNKLIREGDNR